MQRNHLAIGLALIFLTVCGTWGCDWGPEPDDHEDRKEAVTVDGDEADQKVDDYMDAVEDCLNEAKTSRGRERLLRR